jgi:hypothetical protein
MEFIMFNTIKENFFIILAVLFLGLALTFSFTAYGQTSGECAVCAGEFGEDEDCYPVTLGENICLQITSTDCVQGGGSCGPTP